jgi:hypothetical protein
MLARHVGRQTAGLHQRSVDPQPACSRLSQSGVAQQLWVVALLQCQVTRQSDVATWQDDKT